MITKAKQDPGSTIEESHFAGVKPFSTLVAVFLSCSGQKMKFPIKDLFSKCDQIFNFLRSWSHLLKKSLKENFFAVLDFMVGKYLFFIVLSKAHKFRFTRMNDLIIAIEQIL